ncbi:hypothetical protein [Deinococcus multiflagellatus]|uniref:Uncharacterized protein n=1 Tax=Deinococcus multiflagellatus TaxID=1656887 RepID=A0ABW1ZR14_9DEIO|nr:hypothetical protein [Deinococcus multiflagellatus]MBZ9715515.1 hypothetical protein [Deinococcus multiflagellatus]
MKKIALCVVMLPSLLSTAFAQSITQAPVNLTKTPVSFVQPMTTGYWGPWKMLSCERIPFGTESTWQRFYMQLNPSTGEYREQNSQTVTKREQVWAAGFLCTPPYPY